MAQDYHHGVRVVEINEGSRFSLKGLLPWMKLNTAEPLTG